jgi:hypothetical protein
MATNNALNNTIYQHRFCYQLSTDQLNIVGDGATTVNLPLDTIIEDTDGMCAGGSVTLSHSGIWCIGASIKLTNNYADIESISAGPNSTDFIGDIFAFSTYPLSGQTKKTTRFSFNISTNGYIPKGNIVSFTITASWTTATNVFGVLATDAAFPVMMWGYCLAEDYGNLADI